MHILLEYSPKSEPAIGPLGLIVVVLEGFRRTYRTADPYRCLGYSLLDCTYTLSSILSALSTLVDALISYEPHASRARCGHSHGHILVGSMFNSTTA